MSSSAAAPAASVAADISRTVELLAPLYVEVCQDAAGGATAVPVSFRRTAADGVKFVFANVERDVACVHNANGCRCDFERFFKALAELTERRILQVDATYVVAARAFGQPRVATLQIRVRVHEQAKQGTSLKDFDFVLSHLQATVLSIIPQNEQARRTAVTSALDDARNSSCHVVGCRLHPQDITKLATQPERKLNLPEVFYSLTSQKEVDQMEVRDDVTYLTRMTQPKKQVVITDFPSNVLQNIVCMMEARELASLSGVCSMFQHMAYEVAPGLNLVLYEHQRRGLKWMLRRETPSLTCIPQPHPYILFSQAGSDPPTALDMIDHKITRHNQVTARDACGGVFADEPGLGKTITILALILRTKGQTTDNASVETQAHGTNSARPGLRSSAARGRSVQVEELVSSGASLIVVPDPLVEHWKYQIETHVAPGALRVFIDPGVEHTLPFNVDLAGYDVVVTSFTRLTREWKLHRPTSALEERMPERYGFEGPQRYADGTLRGEVSSLLTVHWVRVVVDEGHKLGGQTPSDLMQLARLLFAERRWVMTGTPTPNTLQSADLRYMHGLLVFLRNLPYGNPDGQAWIKAIARPFERNEIVGFYRLQHLLSRIMMRHTKDSIREILPEPIRRTVFIDPTPSEYSQYNGVAAAVRANLVITNMDPKTPGSLHPDSLLNPINRKEALRVIANLRSACCGGAAVKVSLTDKSRLETINMLNALNVNGDNMASVIDYLRRVKLQGAVTECGSCRRELQLLMIIPCGHLCCADCIEDRMQKVGPSCFRCGAVFDREAFIELQPGFEFEMVEDVAIEANGLLLNENDRHRGRVNQIQQLVNRGERQEREGHGGRGDRGLGRNRRAQAGDVIPNAPRQPRRALDLTRDIHFIDASKAFYAATRIKELKEEFAGTSLRRSSWRQAHCLKVIIFSQFKEHIWHTKVAFAQQGVPTADFIAGLSPQVRMKQLMRFRKDPNVNVLLLTDVGSHGLDLSFVTHIFLMDEIWDKSLEQQVVSRAHRMGASQAVVVEQLWMRGSIESQMLRPQESEEHHDGSEDNRTTGNVPTKPIGIVTQAGDSPGKPPTKANTGSGKMFNAPSKKRKRHKSAASDARKAVKGNKRSYLQRKLTYVLNNLRLLGESIVAEAGQVRFFVVDEHKEVIRQAIHVMPNRGSRGLALSETQSAHGPAPPSQIIAPNEASSTSSEPRAVPSEPISPAQSTVQSGTRRRVTFSEESSTPRPGNVIVIDSSSGEDEDFEVTRTAQNAQRRWAKRRSIVAALNSDEDDEEMKTATVDVKAEVKHNGKVTFAIAIDDEDTESE